MSNVVIGNTFTDHNLFYMIDRWIENKAKEFFKIEHKDEISTLLMVDIMRMYDIVYNSKFEAPYLTFTLSEELLSLIILES